MVVFNMEIIRFHRFLSLGGLDNIFSNTRQASENESWQRIGCNMCVHPWLLERNGICFQVAGRLSHRLECMQSLRTTTFADLLCQSFLRRS